MLTVAVCLVFFDILFSAYHLWFEIDTIPIITDNTATNVSSFLGATLQRWILKMIPYRKFPAWI